MLLKSEEKLILEIYDFVVDTGLGGVMITTSKQCALSEENEYENLQPNTSIYDWRV